MNINPFEILKNAQKLQEQMGALQNKLAAIVVTGQAGGGMVEVDLNGKMEVRAVRIAPEAAEDIPMLQDLVMAAFTTALEKARERTGAEMGTLASGMGIPPGTIPGGFPAGQ
ncbi:MAG: YbaB/EbfC family nucleoid-associated protein [Treponema sp.]|jgi:DNA-binding YbaB/EbfC family protein|nr:YbaB/EbfC family nucleoid-associated protein [Treponema sp.]